MQLSLHASKISTLRAIHEQVPAIVTRITVKSCISKDAASFGPLQRCLAKNFDAVQCQAVHASGESSSVARELGSPWLRWSHERKFACHAEEGLV